ncbi:MAG: hypothetical protein P8J32_05340 [bacterium]|nr:hypothetical protein [bacterium]
MKYSSRFERDYEWYMSVSDIFCFDGCKHYFNKKGQDLVQFDKNGFTAKKCFYLYDSSGVIKHTREPEELLRILKTKGSTNLHIKMYAEDRARGYLPKIEFEIICDEINAPDWFIEAVEQQKKKYYL